MEGAVIYPMALAVLSVFVLLLERFFPWRPEQRQARPYLWSDVLHLVFNGHFLGIILYGIAVYRVLPWVDTWLDDAGLLGGVYRNAAAAWPMALQILVALFVVDFLQWCVHNLLHRVPFLWSWHKVHHSVKDGEMDWIVSFRFQWTEVVLYKALLYLPLAWFGFAPEALLFHAVFGTLIGHLNHANLDIDWGWGKYVLNSPRMHIWHHDYDAPMPGYNYGIIFSIWDWVFGTAHMPDHPPRKIGYPGVEEVPEDFFGQQAWQLENLVPALRTHHVALGGIGVGVLAAGWLLHNPPKPGTPMLGEQAAASQPAPPSRRVAIDFADTPEQADAAIARFGTDAAADGYAHPEWMVSPREVAEALGSERLVLLDVRPAERVTSGRIPTAQGIERDDYSTSTPAPGVSADVASLEAMLRRRGVDADDVVVLYGDGGPEPYRLWWTLRTVAGFDTRVLDGGLPAWKALGQAVAGGETLSVAEGDVALATRAGDRRHLLLADLTAVREAHPDLVLVDTRSEVEFTGDEQHRKAERAGRIPGARHLDWVKVLVDADADPRLRSVEALRTLLTPFWSDDGVVTYCQSGTRSSGVYFAMLQAGFTEDRLWNYDGSWAEYSRAAELPVETGPVTLASTP